MSAVAGSLSVGIIGAGPGGLALGIFLRKAGFDDFTIFTRAFWRTTRRFTASDYTFHPQAVPMIPAGAAHTAADR